jgi:hypothetical protein
METAFLAVSIEICSKTISIAEFMDNQRLEQICAPREISDVSVNITCWSVSGAKFGLAVSVITYCII